MINANLVVSAVIREEKGGKRGIVLVWDAAGGSFKRKKENILSKAAIEQ
jgi:hypothetical protein